MNHNNDKNIAIDVHWIFIVNLSFQINIPNQYIEIAMYSMFEFKQPDSFIIKL